jgi:energy-coupling factor transporter ATP-binding protein EcfA2
MKVLIYGLPGSGKTTLVKKLYQTLGEDKVAWFNADKVREEADDWDFSEEGRIRQNERMNKLSDNASAEGQIAIADFVAPFHDQRLIFNADIEIFMDTIEEGRFEDTNKVFQRSVYADYTCDSWNDDDPVNIAWLIGSRFFDVQKPTTQMLGRYQPWHDGHQALFERALAKHGQVNIMVRDMPTDKNNPYTAQEVIANLSKQLVSFAGQVMFSIVPNIVNITYGRDVGYKIEQEQFDKEIENISATKIREESKCLKI